MAYILMQYMWNPWFQTILTASHWAYQLAKSSSTQSLFFIHFPKTLYTKMSGGGLGTIRGLQSLGWGEGERIKNGMEESSDELLWVWLLLGPWLQAWQFGIKVTHHLSCKVIVTMMCSYRSRILVRLAVV